MTVSIRQTTNSIGMGPLTFDVTMARKHGWTDEEIEAAWGKLTAIYRGFLPAIERRHPKHHAIAEDGSIVFVGDDGLPKGWTYFERLDIDCHFEDKNEVGIGVALVIDAYVVGHFAAHPWGDGPDGRNWTVTHVPSGYQIGVRPLAVEEAMRVICHLHRDLGDKLATANGLLLHTISMRMSVARALFEAV